MIDQARDYWQRLMSSSSVAWNRFWFAPSQPLGLSLARAGVGLVLLLYWLSFLPNPLLWFGSEGLLPLKSWGIGTGANIQEVYRLSLFLLGESPVYVWFLTIVGIASALAVMLGVGGRISVLIAWVMMLSAVHRLPMFTGLVEPLLTMALPYLVIGRSSDRFSLDAWLRSRQETPKVLKPSSLSTLSLRLLQLHLLFFYLVIVTSQMRLNTWWDGLAVWTMMAASERRMINWEFLGTYTYLLNVITYAIVIAQWAFILLIWNRLTRPLVLAGSIVLWSAVLLISGMVEFSLMMMVLGAVFIEDDFWSKESLRPLAHNR